MHSGLSSISSGTERANLMDLIYPIQGAPQNIISLSRSVGTDGVESANYGMVVLEYGHGVSLARTVCTEYGGHRRRQLVVTGTKATCEPFDRYTDMLTNFALCVRGEKENPHTPDYELEVYKLLLQCCGA